MPSDLLSECGDGFVLKPVQTLRTIDATLESLSQHLHSATHVAIDCSGVEEADVSILQVLLAARVSAERLGIGLRLVAPSPALLGVAERAGVAAANPADPFWTGAAP